MESGLVKCIRKIRVYPQSQKKSKELIELVRQQRRAYNRAIARFIDANRSLTDYKGEKLKRTTLRATIRDFVKAEVAERGGIFRSADCVEAVNAAFRARNTVIQNKKGDEKCDFSLRSIKDVRQRLMFQEPGPIYVEKNLYLIELMPEKVWHKLTTVMFERGPWFICVQKHIVTKEQGENQARFIVAINPGVRTFATAYSVNHAAKHGDGFYANKVFPPLLELDAWIGLRAKSKHRDRKRHYQNIIDILAIRIRNLVDDLHRPVAHDLVKNRDVILLPSLKTCEMCSKTELKIRTRTGQSIFGLAHYRFRQYLEWMVRKYCKRLINCVEAYTRKTISWTGEIIHNLGGATTIPDDGFTVERDFNGARSVILRALYHGNKGRFRIDGRNSCVRCGINRVLPLSGRITPFRENHNDCSRTLY